MPRGATFGDAIALALARQAIEGRGITPADFEGKNQTMTIIWDMPMPTSPVIQSPAVEPSRGESD